MPPSLQTQMGLPGGIDRAGSLPVGAKIHGRLGDFNNDGYLDGASATTWYLHYVGLPQRPFVYAANYENEVFTLGFGSEYHITFNKIRIVTRSRFAIGAYRFDRTGRVA